MTRQLSHDEAFVALGALALDAVDAAERVAVLSHVSDCDLCRIELESLRGSASNIAFAAPPAADSATGSRGRVRDRLTSRATAEGQARRLANPPLVFPKGTEVASQPVMSRARAFQPKPRRRRHPAEWVALAAGLLFAVTLGALVKSWGDRAQLEEALVSQPVKDLKARHVADSLTALLAGRDSTIAGLVGRDVSMMTLTSRGGKESYARMFWDRPRNSWTMFARNMPALKAGRTYQLWIVTSKGTVSAGTFEAVNGVGFMRASFAVTSENLRAVAVTEEPLGGVPQPTGETVISAANAR
jgi:Anti-sigma-K factor rskA, C-terminal